MKLQRDEHVWSIGLLCIIATAAVGTSAQTLAAPAIIIGLLSCYLLLGVPTMPRPRSVLAFVLLIPFGLWFQSLGDHVQSNHYVPVTLLYIVGLYMLALAAHHIMAVRRGGSRDYALACAVMGMGMAGTAENNPAYIPLLAAFIPLLLWHLRQQMLVGSTWNWRRAPWGRLGAAAVAAGVVTVLLHVFVVEQIPVLNRWAVNQLMQQVSRPASVDFDRSTDLKSVLQIWGKHPNPAEQEIALRVFAENKPDPYLRGAVYDTYDDGVWTVIDETQPLTPNGSYLGRNLFNTRSVESDQLEAMVYPDPRYGDTFFLPINVHEVASFVERARYGRAYTVRAVHGVTAGGYAYFASRVQMPAPIDIDLQVPGSLRPQLAQIASKIMSHDVSKQKNILRLQTFFRDNFTYQRGMKRHTNKDPVLEFLQDNRKGHCEYFATAATLLLRVEGIPARYVTGFVADEQALGNVWIARRKDAHAWVEAYLGPKQGWQTVEATPPSARPKTIPVRGVARLTQWISIEWDRFAQLLIHGGFKAIAAAAWNFITTLPQRVPTWGWLLLVAIGVGWVFRDNIRQTIRQHGGPPTPPHVHRMQRQLDRAERLLSRHGLPRPPGMTVARYLAKLTESSQIPPAVRAEVEPLLRDYDARRFTAPFGGEPAES